MCYHRIQCKVKEISSDGQVLVEGEEGYLLKCSGKDYNVFWSYRNDKVFLKDHNLRVEYTGKSFDMLLQAKIHKEKVELGVGIENDEIRIYVVKFI